MDKEKKQHFTEGIQMTNKYIKRYSISLAIREIQIKITIRYQKTCIRTAKKN